MKTEFYTHRSLRVTYICIYRRNESASVSHMDVTVVFTCGILDRIIMSTMFRSAINCCFSLFFVFLSQLGWINFQTIRDKRCRLDNNVS